MKKLEQYQWHQPRGVNMKGYPLSIDVKMSDGTTITYKRG